MQVVNFAGMETRQEIINIAYDLLREKGYNAFSFSDIGSELKIKNASIHYHFPKKTDLGVAIIKDQQQKLFRLIESSAGREPVQKLKMFLSLYSKTKLENKICLVGSLATDLYTLEAPIRDHLKDFVDHTLQWVITILEEGRKKKVFHFRESGRTKALLILTNMAAGLQITRLTSHRDFQQIQRTVINDLLCKR